MKNGSVRVREGGGGVRCGLRATTAGLRLWCKHTPVPRCPFPFASVCGRAIRVGSVAGCLLVRHPFWWLFPRRRWAAGRGYELDEYDYEYDSELRLASRDRLF